MCSQNPAILSRRLVGQVYIEHQTTWSRTSWFLYSMMWTCLDAPRFLFTPRHSASLPLSSAVSPQVFFLRGFEKNTTQNTAPSITNVVCSPSLLLRLLFIAEKARSAETVRAARALRSCHEHNSIYCDRLK